MALWFIWSVVAAGDDVALGRFYGETAPLRFGRFCVGGRRFGVRGFRSGSERRRRLDCSGWRLISRVHIEPVFDLTRIFQPKLAAFGAGVRDLSGRICTFEGLRRKVT